MTGSREGAMILGGIVAVLLAASGYPGWRRRARAVLSLAALAGLLLTIAVYV